MTRLMGGAGETLSHTHTLSITESVLVESSVLHLHKAPSFHQTERYIILRLLPRRSCAGSGLIWPSQLRWLEGGSLGPVHC